MRPRVVLEPLSANEHAPLVRRILASSSAEGRYRGFGPASSQESLDRILRENVLCQSLLVDRSDQAVGLAQCLVANFRHGTAQLGVALAPHVRRTGWPLLGVVLFVDEVFRSNRLRKLYVEVPANNIPQLSTGVHRLFQWEATFAEHEYFEGGYQDVHFYSLTYERFQNEKQFQRLLRAARRTESG